MTVRWNNPTRRGFTLIEVLAVVAIIALLVAILLPAFNRIRVHARRASSQALLSTISVGLEQHKSELNVLPASRLLNFDGGDWYGCQTLVQAMIGYLDGSADGKDGEGFRVLRGERVHGPYVDSGKVRTRELEAPDGPARVAFLDSFDNPVLYYHDKEAVDNNGDGIADEFVFRSSDNPHDKSPAGPEDINLYARRGDGSAPLPRTDFLLITRGFDGEWNQPWNKPQDVDDVTNFLP